MRILEQLKLEWTDADLQAKIEKESAEELRDYIERIKKLNDREG